MVIQLTDGLELDDISLLVYEGGLRWRSVAEHLNPCSAKWGGFVGVKWPVVSFGQRRLHCDGSNLKKHPQRVLSGLRIPVV